jgi:hypothetical protein
VHTFVWWPGFGGDSYGVTVRHRAGEDWTHYRLIWWQRRRNPASRREMVRNKSRSRRTGTVVVRAPVTVFELAKWRTKGGTTERTGTKGYVRVKVALPGRAA